MFHIFLQCNVLNKTSTLTFTCECNLFFECNLSKFNDDAVSFWLQYILITFSLYLHCLSIHPTFIVFVCFAFQYITPLVFFVFYFHISLVNTWTNCINAYDPPILVHRWTTWAISWLLLTWSRSWWSPAKTAASCSSVVRPTRRPSLTWCWQSKANPRHTTPRPSTTTQSYSRWEP